MPVSRRTALTPVQQINDVWLKRDDLWSAPGLPARGGKARTAAAVCRRAIELGVREVCSVNDRNSSVPGMLARVCRHYGVRLRVWLPAAAGGLPGVFEEARACGAVLEEVRPGYMSVRRKRLRDYVAASGGKAVELGVGLQWDNCGLSETADQAENVGTLVDAGTVKRVVIPVGSGGMLKAVVLGLGARGVPVLGVCCGNQPEMNWSYSNLELVSSGLAFNDELPGVKLGDVELDPVYEAKCVRFLREGDLLWVVAHRATE